MMKIEIKKGAVGADKSGNAHTVFFPNKPRVTGRHAVVGPKEGRGPMKAYFKDILKDDKMGQKTFERAEEKILERAVFGAIDDAGLKQGEVDVLFSGDLLNQIITSSFVARKFNTSYIGLYGACSTMAESLALGACVVNAGYFKTAACATGSHFSSAERQYRGPLELGNQRPPYAQWTVTAAACTLLSSLPGKGPRVTSATFGKVVDYGITDINNMGAAMAPAAMKTLTAHFENTRTKPGDYDLIVTGDLGKLGSDILRDLCGEKKWDLGANYHDCGAMIYEFRDSVCQGGSGCGCGAAILNTYIMDKMAAGELNKVLFTATGALMSPVSSWQGESIPSIAHAVVLENA